STETSGRRSARRASSPHLRPPRRTREPSGVRKWVRSQVEPSELERVRKDIERAQRSGWERCARPERHQRVGSMQSPVRRMVLRPLACRAKVEALGRGDEEVAGPLARKQGRESEGRVGPPLVERACERIARCCAVKRRVERRAVLKQSTLCEA